MAQVFDLHVHCCFPACHKHVFCIFCGLSRKASEDSIVFGDEVEVVYFWAFLKERLRDDVEGFFLHFL